MYVSPGQVNSACLNIDSAYQTNIRVVDLLDGTTLYSEVSQYLTLAFSVDISYLAINPHPGSSGNGTSKIENVSVNGQQVIFHTVNPGQAGYITTSNGLNCALNGETLNIFSDGGSGQYCYVDLPDLGDSFEVQFDLYVTSVDYDGQVQPFLNGQPTTAYTGPEANLVGIALGHDDSGYSASASIRRDSTQLIAGSVWHYSTGKWYRFIYKYVALAQ